MKAAFLAIVAMTATLSTTGAMAQPTAGAAGFAGRWRVAGVAVADDGVQALGNDDPSLMGKRLAFSAATLAWDGPTATNDRCVGPRFTPLGTPAPAALRPELRKLGMPRPTAFTIHCRSGSWGPGDNAMIFRGAGGVLAMPWYDGGLLKLVRQ